MTENPIRQEAWKRHKSGDYSGAEGLYRELLRENPHEIDICNLGALLRAVGRGSEAFILYKKWLDKYTGSASLIQNAVNCALSENHKIEQDIGLLKVRKRQGQHRANKAKRSHIAEGGKII